MKRNDPGAAIVLAIGLSLILTGVLDSILKGVAVSLSLYRRFSNGPPLDTGGLSDGLLKIGLGIMLLRKR